VIIQLQRWWLVLALTLVADAARADVKIAATIAPVHSLVSMVTKGITEPALIIRPGASPHGYAMKPSEGRALDEADLVFWVGRSLEFWMEKAIDTLAADAKVIELAAAEGTHRLGIREGGVWEDHEDHGHNEDGHDEQAKGGNAHDTTMHDPHLWLDPDNAILWVQVAAAELASLDPDNAPIYKANASAAEARLVKMTSAMRKDLEAIRTAPYIVFHDAYQYFERYFGLNAVGAISLSDADRPSAARLFEIQKRIEESGATCAFAEPQFEPKLLDTVIQGQQVAKGVLDPMGADLEPGAELYPVLMTRLAASLMDCLAQ
jgi:zinc transport system substrate-binding protein